MEPIESSETSAYINTLTPGTYPKEKKLQSKHGESLKSRISCRIFDNVVVSKVFSGRQSRRMSYKIQGFGDQLCPHYKVGGYCEDGDGVGYVGFYNLSEAAVCPRRIYGVIY